MEHQHPVEIGEQVYKADGWALYATGDETLQVMEWQDECAAQLAFALHTTLTQHALNTNCVSRHGDRSLLVRTLTPIELEVTVQTTPNDAQLTVLDRKGVALSRQEAERAPGCKPSRFDVIEDVSLHTGRCLRAHLAPMGCTNFALHLRFGITAGGETQLQVPNPLECQFGNEDYERLCQQLGHKH